MAYTDAGTEIRRLFVDSGPKWKISGRNSLWTYEVPGTSLTCKKGTEFCVDHVIVARGWQPVNNSNRNLRILLQKKSFVYPTPFGMNDQDWKKVS